MTIAGLSVELDGLEHFRVFNARRFRFYQAVRNLRIAPGRTAASLGRPMFADVFQRPANVREHPAESLPDVVGDDRSDRLEAIFLQCRVYRTAFRTSFARRRHWQHPFQHRWS